MTWMRGTTAPCCTLTWGRAAKPSKAWSRCVGGGVGGLGGGDWCLQGRPLQTTPAPPIPPVRARHTAPPQVQAARPDHGEVPKALARLYHRSGQPQRAVAVLQAHLTAYPAQARAGRAGQLLGGAGRRICSLAALKRVSASDHATLPKPHSRLHARRRT